MTEPQDFTDELIFPDETDETDGAGDAAHEIPTGTQTVTAALDESGWRLDKFLVYHFPDFSRVMMRNAITDGNVFVDGKTAKPASIGDVDLAKLGLATV